jgi:hypothetical protein
MEYLKMTFPNRPLRLSHLFRAGLVLLVLANIARFFLYSSAKFPAWMTHGVTGLLYGLSIALLLSGLVRNSRRECRTETNARSGA